MTTSQHFTDEPRDLPVDSDEERQRLMNDAVERGIDPDEAVRVAEMIAAGHAEAEDYRFVDRRLVTGHSLDEVKAAALDG